MRKFIGLLAFLFVTCIATFAGADNVGVYNKYDFKVGTPVPELKIRFVPEFAFTDTAKGMQQAVTRLGPSLKLEDWVTVGLNGYVSETGPKQDVKAEIQPDLSAKLGVFKLNDRNRLGYRALNAAVGDRVQYANELRINLKTGCLCHSLLMKSS